MSQISAPVLPATSEQLALVAALGQRADDARTSWLGMPAVLLEHEGEVLSDELRTRDAAFTGRTGKQPIVLGIQCAVSSDCASRYTRTRASRRSGASSSGDPFRADSSRRL